MKLTALGLIFRPFQTRSGPGFLKRLMAADSVWRERQALDRMDPDRLKDLGLTRRDVDEEKRKALWDVPQHWLR